MPLPVSHPHQRYSVTGYQEQDTDDGVRWSCELLRHGQSIGLVGGDDAGGPDHYTFPDPARGEEFLAAARALHPAAQRPGDVLVEELVTFRMLNSLDQVAYCFAEDRFEETGGYRLAEPGRTSAQVREELAAQHAERRPRVWDRNLSQMVPVLPQG
ncbi:hypothetical protein GTQ99_08070 [Kineococcus sp. T13]|uniref:hypothetical protein n=1 Tax=Kineococcus vitellinus TaxID=2696565 RepID=UPI001411EBE1|nr:hypothetical protein [Kineococcus vitellinus]NAZ75377.1 hypothetical protein [Kineococcus vitellinus]